MYMEGVSGLCFVAGCGTAPALSTGRVVCIRPPPRSRSRSRPHQSVRAGPSGDESVDAMRSRLEGLFGGRRDDGSRGNDGRPFDGAQLRRLIKDRFTVEYDVQPVVRHGRVYLHIMWRYYEQVSFYMDEEQWTEHMEAVADLLKKWGAVDYFRKYIQTVKKRPVVGISLNVPIPNITKGSPLFPTSGSFD